MVLVREVFIKRFLKTVKISVLLKKEAKRFICYEKFKFNTQNLHLWQQNRAIIFFL